jgi:hypothetical protein
MLKRRRVKHTRTLKERLAVVHLPLGSLSGFRNYGQVN